MNINHSVEEVVNGDRLEAIFTRQKELMEKYHHIEVRSGLLQTEDCPVNLDDRRGQARIKDFAWRMTEEVGEALDAKGIDIEHYLEELIDGLHFLTELTILAGFSPKDLRDKLRIQGDVDTLTGIFQSENNYEGLAEVTTLVRELGMMCNCLKNKPWKQSQMRTDKDAFYSRLANVWSVYIKMLGQEINMDGITQTYLKKSQVNKFRQRSNY